MCRSLAWRLFFAFVHGYEQHLTRLVGWVNDFPQMTHGMVAWSANLPFRMPYALLLQYSPQYF
jgi:hypothetical protein